MAAKEVKKSVPKKRKVNGYHMPEKFDKGEVIIDTAKNSWCLGSTIGKGGFGEIYTASKLGEKVKDGYVVKIEPSENGPMFCERNTYIRIGKKEDIEEFKKLKKLKLLGMPQFYGFGQHDYKGIKHRFLVIERYGRDIWSIFLENHRVFPVQTVAKLAVQVLNVLEYIHSKGYVHQDIKGANLVLGLKKGTENQVYLVDLGLAARFIDQPYKPDPKKAHNGTIEYLSRDSHDGVPTRRGDLEILGYNLLQWSVSKLPWEKNLSNAKEVQTQKINCMKDIPGFLNKCFNSQKPYQFLLDYLEIVNRLNYDEEPLYSAIHASLTAELKRHNCPLDGKLDFVSQGASGDGKAKSTTKSTNRTTPRGKALAEMKQSPQISSPVKKRTSPRNKGSIETVKNNLKKDNVKVEVKRSWRDCPTIVNGSSRFEKQDETGNKKFKTSN